jgi:hypothetical protein
LIFKIDWNYTASKKMGFQDGDKILKVDGKVQKDLENSLNIFK